MWEVGERSLIKLFQSENADSGGEINTFLSISFVIRRVFSILRQKIYRLMPSEMEIEVLIPAPKKYVIMKRNYQKFSKFGKSKCNVGINSSDE